MGVRSLKIDSILEAERMDAGHLTLRPGAFLGFAVAWMITVRGEDSPEIYESLLKTLHGNWFFLLLALCWTELGFLLILKATHDRWPLILCSVDLLLAAYRILVHQQNVLAIRKGRRPSHSRVVITSVAWVVLLAVEIAGLLSVPHVRMAVLAAMLSIGFLGFGPSRFAAFPRLALVLMGTSAAGFAIELSLSPFTALHRLVWLVPPALAAFTVVLYSVHGTLLSSFRAQRRYHDLSMTDSLTGLANRKQTQERLAELCESMNRCDDGSGFAVFCIDLDNFKIINDSLGHAAGDQLLIRIGSALRAVVRVQDLVGRIGGDEFVVLLPGADRETAIALAERLRLACRDALGSQIGTRYSTTLSLGIALGPEHGANPEILLSHADEALYQVKRSEKGGFRMYAPEGPKSSIPERTMVEAFSGAPSGTGWSGSVPAESGGKLCFGDMQG